MTLMDAVLLVLIAGVAGLYWREQRRHAAAQQLLDFRWAEARDLGRELRDAQARVAALSAAPPHALLILDADGLIVYANDRAIKLRGESIVDQTVIAATRSYEIDAVVQKALDVRAPQEQQVKWNERAYDVRVVPVDGGGAVVVMEDQTDLQRLERVRRDFVANVSHELRTPLASIRLLVETLLAGAKDDPNVAGRMLNQVIAEVDALTQLAQELLDLSMIESGQMPMQLSRVRLRSVAADQVSHFEPQAKQKKITLLNSVPDDLEAEIDQKMIGRVLGNLIHNSLKFTPAGGQIVVGGKAAGDNVILSVTDTGVGIPPEDLPRIFERFYKVDRARGKSGTGLGLAIARHVIEAHHGRIWAESQPGKGATFCVSVPVRR